MLFKFKSKACADLIMLEADGRRILRAMIGQEPHKGIVLVADMPAALQRLEAAVAEDEARRKALAEQMARGELDKSQHSEEALPAVRLAQRAMPMLDMLRRSLAEEADLVWGV
jgi:hypothetical protein